MRKPGIPLMSLMAFMLVQASIVVAQNLTTITLAPLKPSVAVQQTLQFTAQVTGLANTAVTWTVGGVVGGNSTYGTISATGLYTAPATMPAQNPVKIVATSVANRSLGASTTVNIIAAGPTITSVTPNPLAAGTINVTIKGTGFLTGATVLDTFSGAIH